MVGISLGLSLRTPINHKASGFEKFPAAEAEVKKPAKVTPICMVDKNPDGFSTSCKTFLAFLFLAVYMQKNSEMKKEKDMLNLYISEQQKHIELMVEKEQDMKKFRHDVRQHMGIISYHLDKGDTDAASEYISQIYEIWYWNKNSPCVLPFGEVQY